MDTYIHATIAMLAVINPVVCGTMILEAEQNQDNKSKIIAAIKAMLAVWVILVISALAGQYILNAFGISMDAFKVVGGMILAFIGFQLLGGVKSDNNTNNSQGGIMQLIMFAASPGTITMVITLAAVHNAEGIPISAIVGATLAVVITTLIMIIMLLVINKKKSGGQNLVSRFMGLIIVAMGLQFLLDGIKHFFNM